MSKRGGKQTIIVTRNNADVRRANELSRLLPSLAQKARDEVNDTLQSDNVMDVGQRLRRVGLGMSPNRGRWTDHATAKRTPYGDGPR